MEKTLDNLNKDVEKLEEFKARLIWGVGFVLVVCGTVFGFEIRSIPGKVDALVDEKLETEGLSRIVLRLHSADDEAKTELGKIANVRANADSLLAAAAQSALTGTANIDKGTWTSGGGNRWTIARTIPLPAGRFLIPPQVICGIKYLDAPTDKVGLRVSVTTDCHSVNEFTVTFATWATSSPMVNAVEVDWCALPVVRPLIHQ